MTLIGVLRGNGLGAVQKFSNYSIGTTMNRLLRLSHEKGLFMIYVLGAGFSVLLPPPLLAQEAEHPSHQADRSAKEGFALCAKPKYPRAALMKDAEGTVTIKFSIGVDGDAKDATIWTSSGSMDLDEAAREAILKCHFKPAIVDGKPVEAQTKLQYVWSLQRRGGYSQ